MSWKEGTPKPKSTLTCVAVGVNVARVMFVLTCVGMVGGVVGGNWIDVSVGEGGCVMTAAVCVRAIAIAISLSVVTLLPPLHAVIMRLRFK